MDQETRLIIAIMSGSVYRVSQILQKFDVSMFSSTTRHSFALKILRSAVSNENGNRGVILNLVLKQCRKIDFRRDKRDFPFLHRFVVRGEFAFIEMLLRHKSQGSRLLQISHSYKVCESF